MNDFQIREGKTSDIPLLQKLNMLAYGQYRSVISNGNWVKWKTSFESEKTFLDLFDCATCFVCEYNQEIVGAVFYVPHGNPFLYFESDWSYIRFLAVNPNYEGKGIGRALTLRCINEAKNTGEKIIALHTSEYQNAARHLYENLGFVQQNEFLLYDKKYWIYKLKL